MLATLPKGFFGPVMVPSPITLCAGILGNVQAKWPRGTSFEATRSWFHGHGFWLRLRRLIDVSLFTLGFLIESRRLGNEIRSVDSTWLGRAAALACNPPLNTLTGAILGSQHEDFPRFADPTVHPMANGSLLALMAVYAASSVALGLEASNLTHLGIVSRGPYAWVRHPADTCKHLAWWIGSIPLVGQAFAAGWLDGLMAAGSVAGWTALCVLRALTEEDHLRSVGGDYAAHARRVRYRFIPGVV